MLKRWTHAIRRWLAQQCLRKACKVTADAVQRLAYSVPGSMERAFIELSIDVGEVWFEIAKALLP